MKSALLFGAAMALMHPMNAAETVMDMDRLIGCIAEVEQGRWGKPGGACNIGYALWSDHSRLAYQMSGHRAQALIIYKLCLHEYAARLVRIDRKPTPHALASLWRYGWGGAYCRGFTSLYGEQIENLYNDATFAATIPN